MQLLAVDPGLNAKERELGASIHGLLLLECGCDQLVCAPACDFAAAIDSHLKL